jgi:hypothetical protein
MTSIPAGIFTDSFIVPAPRYAEGRNPFESVASILRVSFGENCLVSILGPNSLI